MDTRFYSVDEESNSAVLSPRQKRLVEGAMTYNSLLQPGRRLTYKVYFGADCKYPRLTDVSTLDGILTEGAGLKPACEFEVTSLVNPTSEFSSHFYFDDMPVIDSGVRYISLTPDDACDDDLMIGREYTAKEKVYRDLESSHPLLLDGIREITRKKRIAEGKRGIKPAEVPTYEWAIRKSQRPLSNIAPGAMVDGAPGAVIIAMHWLQAGGAERWAMETIKIVRDAGLVPIVITSIDSHQPWITDPILDDAVVMNLTFPAQERPGDEPLLRALFEQFDIRGILIHHCQWMYDRLWWVKKYCADTPVVDSLHIVEYRWRGGFPAEGVSHDQYVDVHHVISSQLVDWMTRVHGIAPSKVIDAPLVDLTAGSDALKFKPRKDDSKLSLAFVGRMNRQKRPDAFILLAKKLEKKHPGRYRFILHGSGDIDAVVERMLERYGLTDVIERRGIEVPVGDTYRDSDVLIVSSVNEGITLTTFEAISAGIPVLSTDVGSQSTVVPADALLGMSTGTFLRKAIPLLENVLTDEARRESIWKQEVEMVNDFSHLETANHLFARLVNDWK